MFSTILVPLDGSDTAAAALPVAMEFAQRFDARLHLIQVVDVGSASLALAANAASGGMTDPSAITTGVDERVEVAKAYLSAVADQATAAGIATTYEVHDGPVGDAIIEVARSVAADLIVISSHGRTGFRRLVFGSVAAEVVRTAPMPVMVVRLG